MNKDYKETLEKVIVPISKSISTVLEKVKEKVGDKEGFSLLDITKKLSEKKFGKKKR